MPNRKPGHFHYSPTYSRRVAITFEEDASSCVTIDSQLSQEDFGTDTSVGTEAVIETDGELDPKLGEGGERPDTNQSNRF